MPLLRRQREAVKRGLRVLTASAVKLDLDDKSEARQLRAIMQGWQSDAWNVRDSIPEIRFAVQYKANAMARLRLFVGVEPEEGEDNHPIPLEQSNIPEQFASIALQALTDLAVDEGQRRELLKKLSASVDIPGEARIMGRIDAETGSEEWSIRSTDEIQPRDEGWYMREIPDGPQGVIPWVKLDPELTSISRIWVPHPRFELMADSPMKALVSTAETLLILRRMVRAEGRSRLNRGMLKWPDELEVNVPTDDNSDPQSDPVFGDFVRAMIEPITDEGVASAYAPIAVRGPAEALKALEHLDFTKPFEEQAMKAREELVGNIAVGLDIPREVVEGMAEANHWSAWLVDDDTFRYHLEPHAITIVDMLTAGYFRERLLALGVPPEYARRMVIWYDAVDLITHPDETKTAMELYDRHAISFETLREKTGFSEEDAPGGVEILLRLLSNMRTPPANVVMAAVHAVDPTLVIPPIETAGTVPGVNTSGVDPGSPPAGEEPPAPIGGEPPALLEPGPPAPAGPEHGPPPITASGNPDLDQVFAQAEGGYGDMWVNETEEKVRISFGDWEAELAEQAQILAEAEYPGYQIDSETEQGEPGMGYDAESKETMPTPDHDNWREVYLQGKRVGELHAKALTAAGYPNHRLSVKLSQIDRDLRARLQTAANAAMLTQLEKTGARIRSRVAKDETMRTKIAHRRNERVSAILGPEAVAAAGISGLPEDWSQLREQFYNWTKAAQEQALATARKIGSLPADAPILTEAKGKLSDGVERAWEWLSGSLSALGEHLMFNPDPNVGPGDWADLNPDTLVPAGMIRAALSVAGGGDVGLIPESSRTIELGVPVGQIGTGPVVESLLEKSGMEAATYEWNHGPALDPFEPHLELDGVQFTSFEDPRLENNTGFPGNQFFFPGDHTGDSCDWTPLWVPAVESEAEPSQEES